MTSNTTPSAITDAFCQARYEERYAYLNNLRKELGCGSFYNTTEETYTFLVRSDDELRRLRNCLNITLRDAAFLYSENTSGGLIAVKVAVR
jgi:hypothetical protein